MFTNNTKLSTVVHACFRKMNTTVEVRTLVWTRPRRNISWFCNRIMYLWKLWIIDTLRAWPSTRGHAEKKEYRRKRNAPLGNRRAIAIRGRLRKSNHVIDLLTIVTDLFWAYSARVSSANLGVCYELSLTLQLWQNLPTVSKVIICIYLDLDDSATAVLCARFRSVVSMYLHACQCM